MAVIDDWHHGEMKPLQQLLANAFSTTAIVVAFLVHCLPNAVLCTSTSTCTARITLQRFRISFSLRSLSIKIPRLFCSVNMQQLYGQIVSGSAVPFFLISVAYMGDVLKHNQAQKLRTEKRSHWKNHKNKLKQQRKMNSIVFGENSTQPVDGV